MQTRDTLHTLGWDDWFEKQAKPHCGREYHPARVMTVDRDRYLLLDEHGSFPGKLSGRLRFETVAPEQLPCVGDWVCLEKAPGDEFGLIRDVLARKTRLFRKAVGTSSELQMIAANIDVVFVVQSCHYDFNLKRLERYLVMVAEGGALPHILLTKTDLVSPEELDAQIAQIRAAGIEAPVLPLSNLTREGLDALYGLLAPARTYCFVGSSGVGKSTIINDLLGRQALETKDVSGTGEGRHTTVRRELLLLRNGAMVIDNPGMREFGVLDSGQGMEAGYLDINSLASECRFNNCTHSNEPGCAVLAALEDGTLSREHYDNFIKLREESDFNQLSHSERRKKDRAFGRFIKNAKKDLPDR
jgi:ribosome biogenesis GTPase